MKTKTMAVATLLCGVLLLIGGLGVPRAGTAYASSAPAAKHSTDLNEQVRHQLAMLPWYGVFDNLTYQVNGDEVVLSGQVVNDVTKRDAEHFVKSIEGVSHVVNEIKVLPASGFDDQTRRAEYRSIFSESMLSRYAAPPIPDIHIIVDNGHVTLEGKVATETDKNVATIAADRVPGVFSVTNNLKVGS